MKVVDLRNIFANCNDQLIEISDNRIYYAEEKNEEGHNSLFLLEYNRITRRERILANYILDRPAFVPHFFSFSVSRSASSARRSSVEVCTATWGRRCW